MAILGLDHVQVAAPPGCEADARRFYGDLLGMTEIPKPAELAKRGGAWFQCGAHQLHVGVVQDGFLPASKAHPGIVVASDADLDQLAERLTAAGADVRWDDSTDVYRFEVHDPWGNRLELLAAPSA